MRLQFLHSRAASSDRRVQQVAQGLDLLEHAPPARPSGRITTLDTRLKVEHVLDVRLKGGTHRLELLEGEVGEGNSVLLGKTDARAGDVMRLAERDLSCVSAERAEGGLTPLRTRYSARSVASMSGVRDLAIFSGEILHGVSESYGGAEDVQRESR